MTEPLTMTETSALHVAVAWVIVSVPLSWGVYETLLKSLALFT